MKTKTIFYWICTGIIASVMLSGGIVDVIHQKDAMEGMTRLGYPLYFSSILGTWKILGAIALLIPGTPRLKEWAYAGIFFDFTGAAISHAVCAEYAHIIAPLAFTFVLIASWAL